MIERDSNSRHRIIVTRRLKTRLLLLKKILSYRNQNSYCSNQQFTVNMSSLWSSKVSLGQIGLSIAAKLQNNQIRATIIGSTKLYALCHVNIQKLLFIFFRLL